MDTATESITNGKRARANAQTPSSKQIYALQDARFAASILLALLPATVEGNGILPTQVSNQDTAVLLHYP
jgi:hypothetical protein